MKYGITSSTDETSFEKGENSTAEVGAANAVMATNETTTTAAAAVLVKHSSSGGDEDAAAKDAVIFSIQFYGKTIGEVGMMDQDLAELDWKKFKSYLFQNLLSVNYQENICVSYSDEEGDKLPIDSDEEYQEAVKVAKKKAETHDKMVLDITRQGGFPAMLSLVSSGIKKVSSSPPKEGGISFFKASSPPKDASGMKAVGTERKLFPGFFLPDKGPIPGHVQGLWGYDCDEALECGKVSATSTTATTTTTTTSVPTARTDCKRGPPVRALRNSPPNMLFKYEAPILNLKSTTIDSACQGVFGAGNGDYTGARPKDVRLERDFGEYPPTWFKSYMEKFRSEVCEEVAERVAAIYRNEICEEVGELVTSKVTEALASNKLISPDLDEGQSGWNNLNHVEKRPTTLEDKSQRICLGLKKSMDCDKNEDDQLNKEKLKKRLARACEAGASAPCPDGKMRRKDGKNLGAKQKKLIMEEERLMKKQEKLEKKKFILASKYAEERDKASRTQEKVLAKMEGLRKKQSCSQEEFSKLRKMVDKQQRLITAEQRQQRRNERKTGYQKCGKSKKINIDNKGFPVDASLLHAALQELEALAEDSMSDGAGGATTRGYDARYLKDITFPDGSVVAPGTEFVKTWRVVNNGVMPWNEKTTLCKWSQVRFRGSPAGWKLKPSMKRVVCPPLEPGQEGDISITFTAPSEPGWYATHWRFCQRGRVFGNQMWCAIHVVEESLGFEAPTMEFAKNAGDENGAPKRTISAEEMPELSGLVCQQEPRDPFISKHPYFGRDLHKDVAIPRPREELSMNTDLGIVENYYDAEDPIQRESTESLQKLTLFSPDVESRQLEERKDRDLISFEEEAEVLDSGMSTPEILSSVSQPHSVVPLKEMAKESVENLMSKDPELKLQLKPTVLEEVLQADSISMSSGSFSEFDSEDQAILNESDSEGSDQEYYVVHLPDCFNMSSLHSGLPKLGEGEAQDMVIGSCGDVERPDSTDFLTADEDDRTTAVASDSSDDLTCPVNEHDYASRSSTVSQASYRIKEARDKVQVESQNTASIKASAEGREAEREVSSSLPDPPTDTKPFMSIPNEALQATVLHKVPGISTEQNSQAAKEKEQGTNSWSSGTEGVQNVVCEQPSSAQHKDTQETPSSRDDVTSPSSIAANTNANNLSSQLPVDLVGALPDELVSIIPEDLVRGAWNTARSFITRINQEMLSPTSDSPGRVYAREEESSSEQQQQPPDAPSGNVESVPQHNESVQVRSDVVNERESTSRLPPPLQQLEDMGFHNREVNERLLTKYNGDVSCAVAELIVLNYH